MTMRGKINMEGKQTYQFQAETKQLLDIVIHSLYTDREVFIRELISNASDACEKLRFLQASGAAIFEPEKPPAIFIRTDELKRAFIIEDNGVGMTRDELVENLGTIARSGTKEFIKKLQESKQLESELIGRFGVGFYSAFMVAERITVITRSYKPEEKAWKWISEGAGGFEIEPYEGASRGTKIIVELKQDAEQFCKAAVVEPIVKRFSNFIQFPIELNGKRLNVLQAIWLRNKNEIKEEEYTEFYRYISHDYEAPILKLHFHADAPLSIHALLFVPEHNPEEYGYARFEPSVSIYCKKVLVQQHAKNLLPEWLRFLKGVVDSEDFPLNISREFVQDSSLMNRVRRILTSRFLKFLEETAQNNPSDYEKFYQHYNRFLKEGIINDPDYRNAIAPLLRFESSALEPGKTTSLSDYVKRMPQEQKEIYYLIAADRKSADESPFFEPFKYSSVSKEEPAAQEGQKSSETQEKEEKKPAEVLFLYDPWDEFVMEALREYEGKQIKSIELYEGEIKAADAEKKLTDEQIKELIKWLKETLKGKIADVKVSKRLVKSPALASPTQKFISASLNKYLKTIHPDKNLWKDETYDLEINPSHPLIIKLNSLRAENPDIGKLFAEYIYESAMILGGLTDNPQSAVNRLNDLLAQAFKDK